MNLVFIYGPPATGKYTVGRELARRTGYRLFHNHLVVDTVLSVYDFGTPGFVELRDTIWRAVFSRVAQAPDKDKSKDTGKDKVQPPGLLFTFNPENSVRQDFIDWLFGDYAASGVRILSVALAASEPEIERRLDADSRRKFGKLTDLDLYRRLRAAGVFSAPRIPRTDLCIDTEVCSPTDAAQQIAHAMEKRGLLQGDR